MKCYLDWSYRGAARAGKRGDIVVIIDTLSFSTVVTTAVAQNARIFPTFDKKGSAAYARQVDAEAAVSRKDVPVKGQFSLSPLTMQAAEDGQRIVLPSPNGARCSLAAQGSPFVCAGTIVNTTAVASLVFHKAQEAGSDICLIACGEAVDPYHPDAEIRFALEDFLGAGAIASRLGADKSPELRAAEAAFAEALPNLREVLMACESGQEALDMGFAPDVEFASRHNSIEVVAVFDGEKYSASQPNHTTAFR